MVADAPSRLLEAAAPRRLPTASTRKLTRPQAMLASPAVASPICGPVLGIWSGTLVMAATVNLGLMPVLKQSRE